MITIRITISGSEPLFDENTLEAANATSLRALERVAFFDRIHIHLLEISYFV